MRRTKTRPETRQPKSQLEMDLVEAAIPEFEPLTITRYRVALVREASVPYEATHYCGRAIESARFLHQILSQWDREVMGAILLDVRCRAIGYQLAYIGTLTRAAAEPRGIFSAAILANAAHIILFHNHPSGDPSPSPEDIAFTRRMAHAGEILGISVLDHIIVGEPPGFVSLRERGVL